MPVFSFSNTSSLGLSKPVGTASGDLLVAVTYNLNGSWSPDASFTEVLDSDGIGIFTRIATGAEGSSFTFSKSGAINQSRGTILRIPGAVFDVAGATTTTGNINPSASSITMASGLLFAVFATDTDGYAFPTPTGMTAVASYNTQGSMALFSEGRDGGATGSRTSGPVGGATKATALFSATFA